MNAFRPTRTCPHRLCRPLHAVSAIGALLFITALAPINPWILGTVAVGALFSVGIYQLIHRQTMVDTVREEVEQTVVVTVRPLWARAAAAMDAVWVVFTLAMLASVLADRSSADWEQPPSPALLLPSLAVGVAFMAVGEGLHRRAARVETVSAARSAV